jgi:hypothetical protein
MRSYPLGSLYTLSLDTNPTGSPSGALTNAELLSATLKRILYKKPNGAKGYFNAVVNGVNLDYDFQTTTLTEPGTWCFEAYVKIGANTYLGAIDSVKFEPSLL